MSPENRRFFQEDIRVLEQENIENCFKTNNPLSFSDRPRVQREKPRQHQRQPRRRRAQGVGGKWNYQLTQIKRKLIFLPYPQQIAGLDKDDLLKPESRAVRLQTLADIAKDVQADAVYQTVTRGISNHGPTAVNKIQNPFQNKLKLISHPFLIGQPRPSAECGNAAASGPTISPPTPKHSLPPDSQ